MNDTNAKQQIVDRIKKSSTILVTVSNDPSVDELSAALGLTLLLNKMDKHATAVFSGAIPPAITFLDPERTFENTVDSLRDFIIALDKEKADHLRYKVEGDVVKIFITPYRTTITSDDLDFSQGDYNVELVLALGVKSQDHLDAALSAHGRILHDATVATISAGANKSDLGSIDWMEAGASSLSEMLVSLSDALKGDKALLDEQVATAFLTGIVAATDRFSNNRTSSKVMTIAAQLMAAGANQQLIALKLEEAHEIGDDKKDDTSAHADGTTDLSEDTATKLVKDEPEPVEEPVKDTGELTVSHELDGTLEEVAQATAAEQQEEAAAVAEAELTKQRAESQAAAEAHLADELATVVPPADTPSVADLQHDLAEASQEIAAAAEPMNEEPSFGGTLNATTEQAADAKRQAEEDDRNRTILSHGSGEYIGDQTPSFQSPLNAAAQPSDENSGLFQDSAAPAGMTARVAPIEPPTPVDEPAPEPVTAQPTLADIDAQNRAPHDDARAAVEAAFGAVPYEPAPLPVALPTEEPAEATPASLPSLPPLPDFSQLPEQPTDIPLPPPPTPFGPTVQPPQPPLPPTPPEPTAPSDPSQFRIPGQ